MQKPDCAWNLTDLESVPQNGIKVMSTFACGGGSSMGYKRAGCEVIAANDIDPEMAWHYKLNIKPKHYFLCPIRDLLTADLPPELIYWTALRHAQLLVWLAVVKRHGAKINIFAKGRRSRFCQIYSLTTSTLLAGYALKSLLLKTSKA